MTQIQTMTECTKQQFKDLYFKYGRGLGGWTQEYWDQLFEVDKIPPMKYRVKIPSSPQHSRMMITTDFAVREFRMFFLTIDEEEGFFSR
jgi:hypothetical protein